MNLPNKLTLLRAVLVPVFLLLLFLNIIPVHYTLALVVFAVASITDALDGHIARKNNLVTNFGKFLDPLADKVLVVSALIAFIELDIISSIPGNHYSGKRIHGIRIKTSCGRQRNRSGRRFFRKA